MTGRVRRRLCCGALFTLAVVVFMVTPLLLVVLFSFNQSALTSLPLTGLTLDWYRKLFANDSFWPALQNSLIVGFTVAVVSVVTGTLAALALARMQERRRGRDRSACSASR